jgi:5-methylcytosine-specific restriction endonuclease McrA
VLHRKQLLPIMAAAHYGGMCAYCGIRPADTFDHVIPVGWPGGTNEMVNLEPACKRCNSSKRELTLLEWMTAGGWARMAQPSARPLPAGLITR